MCRSVSVPVPSLSNRSEYSGPKIDDTIRWRHLSKRVEVTGCSKNIGFFSGVCKILFLWKVTLNEVETGPD